MTVFSLSHDCLLLDACCAINLSLSGQMASIIAALPIPVAISEYVYSVEASGKGNSVALTNGALEQVIDLQPLSDAGLLQVIELTELEEVDAVNLSARIDQGEAFTCAIALHRNWAIATDDKKAISFFSENAPNIQLVSTPQLVKHWVDKVSPPEALVREVLHSVRRWGRYLPPKEDPLRAWWAAYSSVG